MTISFRPAELEDRRFICDAWVKALRVSKKSGGFMQRDADYHATQWLQVEKALARPGVRTVMAYETDEPGRVADLYGFITADTTLDPPLVYFVYVPQIYRRGGIATALFKAIGVDPKGRFIYVCETPASVRLRMKIPLAHWDPFPGVFPKEQANADDQDKRQAQHSSRSRARRRDIPTEIRRGNSGQDPQIQATKRRSGG